MKSGLWAASCSTSRASRPARSSGSSSARTRQREDLQDVVADPRGQPLRLEPADRIDLDRVYGQLAPVELESEAMQNVVAAVHPPGHVPERGPVAAVDPKLLVHLAPNRGGRRLPLL